ncbi:autotransporter domain-containing protein [Rhodoplanes sp. TEM]|uniref:Autotransporter domain-containing protein n=1 Tax=Rhodoplanes tepidamans TaxID=200616 RepID=A0ABT5J9X3_RHOTP|nr:MULTISPECIES: autotransporter domain-containing protein [Rhodoplanes]MDC7786467.1 autotransporter domain-containing protein [Rhodoplanes tepidamans]MDC7985109.1 autotransporter domain-containing protein [Rhodoplanes sp. TEM]MDQ0357352.1 outer membrane autotransporter protein [Rhodoplanes tepidamans]
MRTILASGVALAALQAALSDAAVAGCTITGDVAVVSSQCDASFVDVRTGTGATSLTVTDMTTVGVFLAPATGATTPTSHTLTLTGTTIVSNPSYSAVYSYADAPDHDIVVNLGSGVSITSLAGFGAVWIRNETSGDITIDSAATVTATGGPGITATTNLGAVSITNSGTVVSTDDRGIYADGGYNNTSADPVTVSVTNSGTVSGYLAGIRAVNWQGLSSIDNSGTVTATTRQGLVAWSAAGDATIVNSGTVTAYDDVAVQAVAETGTVTVTNSGSLFTYDDTTVTDAGTYGHVGIWAEAGTSGDVVVTNTATGTISAPSGYGIVALTASGDVTVTNAGTVTALGGIRAESSDGDVTVTNSGIVTATAATDPVAVALSVTTGTATFTNTGTVNGGLTTAGGTNEIVNQGTWNLLPTGVTSASWTLTGTSSFTNEGLVTVAAGGSATLDGLTTFTNTASGLISLGAGSSLNLIGTTFYNEGVLSIAAGASLTATTVQVDGTLNVNGTVDGAVVVGETGTLNGSGTIGDTIVTSGGTVAPGNSIGTLTVAGTYTQWASTTYAVEIGANGTSDLIHATGTADIQGGTVAVTTYGIATVGTRYTILTADGGVTGTYDAVANGGAVSAFATATLDYDSTNVYLDVALTRAFTAAAATANQAAAAGAVGGLTNASALYNAVAFLPSDAAAQQAFDQISGEVHASLKGALIETGGLVRDAALDRVRGAFDAVGPQVGATTLWSRSFGMWGTAQGDGNARAFDRSTGGFVVGGDGVVLDGWRLGLLAGYSRTTMSGAAGSASADGYHVGAYGGRQWGALGLRAGAAYTHDDIATSRAVIMSGFSDLPTADYGAGMAQGFVELGWKLPAGRTVLEPFAALAHVNLHTDAFAESGNGAALAAGSDDTAVTFTTLGLHGSADVTLGAALAKLRGTVGWRHAFGDTSPLATLALAGGSAFTVAGAPIARDAFVGDLGLDVAVAANVTAGVSWRGQYGPDITDHGVRGTLAVRF